MRLRPGGALVARSHRAWMLDVHRVLRPGGVVLFTTHGVIFTNQLSDAERERLAAGAVVVRNSEINGAQACSSFDPPVYVRDELLPACGLELVRTVPGDWEHGRIWTAMVLQDKHIARRPLG
jgi:hypothetical protein